MKDKSPKQNNGKANLRHPGHTPHTGKKKAKEH
jgi:hypothetical protein